MDMNQKNRRSFVSFGFLSFGLSAALVFQNGAVKAQSPCTQSEVDQFLKQIETLEQDQIDALAECGSVAVSPLVNALSSSNAQVVYEATNVLYAIGPDATQAVPKLVEILLNHPKADNREYAALALQSIQPSDRATIDALLQAFEQDLSSSVRQAASQGLAANSQGERYVIDILFGSLTIAVLTRIRDRSITQAY